VNACLMHAAGKKKKGQHQKKGVILSTSAEKKKGGFDPFSRDRKKCSGRTAARKFEEKKKSVWYTIRGGGVGVKTAAAKTVRKESPGGKKDPLFLGGRMKKKKRFFDPEVKRSCIGGKRKCFPDQQCGRGKKKVLKRPEPGFKERGGNGSHMKGGGGGKEE